MQIRVKNSAELSNALNEAKAHEKTTIFLEKGDYEIENTIVLKGNIEIIGEDGVNLYGSRRISLDNAEIIGGIYKIKLSDCKIDATDSFGSGPFEDFWEMDIPKPHMDDFGPSAELYFGDKKMNISRYPKAGFLKIEKALGETSLLFRDGRNGSKEGIFVPSDIEFFKNENTENLLLLGYWNVDWAIQRHTIESFDPKSGAVKVNEPYHMFGYRDGECFTGEIGGKFYVLNALTQVKAPGDWYIDKKKNELWLIPFENQNYIDVSVCENMFEAQNASNITIKNINISRCRKSAFKFTDCENIHIEKCRLYHLGAWGVILDKCENSRILYCHIYNTGGGGIACSGGDRSTLRPSGNIIGNNEIHNIAYWHRTYLAAIELNGVGVTACENKIYDVPHFGITYQGNEHIIERNYFRNACYESNDAGAIYAGKDYSCQGNIIRYNCFCDMLGFEGRGCIAIYFDDGVCTAKVYGNTLINVPYIGILVGGGRDYDIHDNMFFDCKMALSMDNRMERWSSGNNGPLKHLNEVPYQNEYWQKAYPKLQTLLEDEPKKPKYNKFYNNTIVGGDGVTCTNETVASYLEHYNNTYIPKINNAPHNPNQEDWFFLTNELNKK